MTLPAGLLPNYRWQALDANGDILPNAELYSFVAGGSFSTPRFLYADSDLTTPLTNPVVADAAGRFPAMYLLGDGGYDIRLKDESGVTIWSCLDVIDVGQVFLQTLGTEYATGSIGVVSGYTVLASDNYVETAPVATSPFIVQLPSASSRTSQITIKHRGSAQLRITPNASDTIEGIAAYYAVAAAASPNFPTVVLLPEPGGSGWIIGASHGL